MRGIQLLTAALILMGATIGSAITNGIMAQSSCTDVLIKDIRGDDLDLYTFDGEQFVQTDTLRTCEIPFPYPASDCGMDGYLLFEWQEEMYLIEERKLSGENSACTCNPEAEGTAGVPGAGQLKQCPAAQCNSAYEGPGISRAPTGQPTCG